MKTIAYMYRGRDCLPHQRSDSRGSSILRIYLEFETGKSLGLGRAETVTM